MSRSSSGGLGPARGTGLESRVLAWLGAHMLAGQGLSDRWVPGGATITAIGGQTARPIDDIGAVTSADGHLLIQAKTRLAQGKTDTSELAKAVRQVVHQYHQGIPADPENGSKLRAVDPARDRLLIVTDRDAPLTVREGLIVAADELSELADSLPFSDVGKNRYVAEGRDVLLLHLRREWNRVHGTRPSDADLRGVLRVLRFAVVDLRDDGPDHGRALQLLERAIADGSSTMAVWRVLTMRCHELAERNHWARKDRLRQKIVSDGIAFRLGYEAEYGTPLVVARSAYLEQIRQRIAPPSLIGRDAELDVLRRFCIEPDRSSYLWWQAEAWAGKSALLSTFVLRPPPEVAERVRLVSLKIHHPEVAGQRAGMAWFVGARAGGGRLSVVSIV